MRTPDKTDSFSADSFQLGMIIRNLHNNLCYLKAEKPGEFTAQFLERAQLFNMSPRVAFFDVIRYVGGVLQELSEHPSYFNDKYAMKNVLHDCSQYLQYLIGTGSLPREPGRELPCWTSYKS